MALDPHTSPARPLLAADDPFPVRVTNPDGPSPFVLIGDHAGNIVPAALGDLGVAEADRNRHIGWDIGVAGLGEHLADALDAPFIAQAYSRLVIDCNRRPEAPDAMPAVSDATPIPANAALGDDDRAARVAAIHEPYQAAIAEAIARRDAARRPSVLVALHSFTPAMQGISRPWQIGVLYDAGDATFARAFLDRLRAMGQLTVGDNEPYRMDLIDYTIPRHAYPARRPYVEIEIRQDLLAGDGDQRRWSEILAQALTRTWGDVGK